jgi:hypothetical protein
MADVFLSYRRDDSRSATGRLADDLQATLGPGRVFRDVASIAPGLDFEAALARAIGGARVVLAVIGPRWLEARDGEGRRRLDDPLDTVRRELEAAVAAGITIVPVLVEGARMPSAQALPPSLAAVARAQAITLDDEGWQDDVRRLMTALRDRHAVEPDLPAAAAPTLPIPRFAARFTEVLELVARPRSIILRLAGVAGTIEVQRACVLLVICLALGNLFIGAALGIELAGWILQGVLLGSLGSAAMAGALGIGWRIAGVRLGWQRATAGAACIVGGAWLYLSTGLLAVTLGYAMVDVAGFEQWIALVRRGSMEQADILAWAGAHARGPALAGIVIASVVWAAGAAWLVRAWNALRIACPAGHFAALVAAAGTLLLVSAVVAAARWAAR